MLLVLVSIWSRVKDRLSAPLMGALSNGKRRARLTTIDSLFMQTLAPSLAEQADHFFCTNLGDSSQTTRCINSQITFFTFISWFSPEPSSSLSIHPSKRINYLSVSHLRPPAFPNNARNEAPKCPSTFAIFFLSFYHISSCYKQLFMIIDRSRLSQERIHCIFFADSTVILFRGWTILFLLVLVSP